jgi:hypothetical protein
MKKLALTLLTFAVSLPSFAVLAEKPNNYVATHFANDRMDKFACTIAGSIKKSYPKKSLNNLRSDILNVLRTEINPWVDAYPIPAGISLPLPFEKLTGLPGFPMDRSEYYMQNAFILYGNPQREHTFI